MCVALPFLSVMPPTAILACQNTSSCGFTVASGEAMDTPGVVGSEGRDQVRAGMGGALPLTAGGCNQWRCTCPARLTGTWCPTDLYVDVSRVMWATRTKTRSFSCPSTARHSAGCMVSRPALQYDPFSKGKVPSDKSSLHSCWKAEGRWTPTATRRGYPGCLKSYSLTQRSAGCYPSASLLAAARSS